MLFSEGRIDKAFSSYEPQSPDGMIHTDHLGTPHMMTDSTGAVVWSAYYKAFGATSVTVSTITNNLRFPGQYFDLETGLNYNYFRDYNAMIGRYIESDHAGLKGGINLYVYVENNAVNVSDLLGLTPVVPTGIVTPGQFPNMANIL
jgi:RHS repeat-associated protein